MELIMELMDISPMSVYILPMVLAILFSLGIVYYCIKKDIEIDGFSNIGSAGIILLVVGTIGFVLLIGASIYMNLPSNNMENYSYSGGIFDVHIKQGTTIVQFEDGKVLNFHSKAHYEMHMSPNATISYAVNKYGKMFFNDIKYEN